MISKTKRSLTFALATAAFTFAIPSAQAEAPRVIKISHQFPAASSEDGDFRDRLVRRFAAEVEKQSKGSLKFEIYPGSSLMKTNSQIGALRKSALDMSLVPLAYGGGEIPRRQQGNGPDAERRRCRRDWHAVLGNLQRDAVRRA